MSLITPLSNSRKDLAARSAAAEDDARFAALVEQMVDGLFVSDSAGRYLDVNPAGCDMLGYSRDEILRLTISDVVAGDELARVDPEVRRLSEGSVVRSEWRFRRKDGSFFVGEVLGRRLADGRLQAILRDVSESRAIEDRLRQAEERYRIALSAAHLGTWRHDIASGLVWLDAEARRCTGIAEEAVPVATVFGQFHPEDAARMKEAVAAALDPGRSTGIAANDFRIVAPDGSVRWLRVHAHVRFDGEGDRRVPVEVVGTMEEITARRSSQERLARLSRAYETRSEINKCVARAVDEFELLFGACRIAATHSGFRLVRVVPLEDALLPQMQAVHYGAAAAAASRPAIAAWPEDTAGRNRVRAALDRDGHYLATDLTRDPLLGSQGQACTEFGLRAACVLPLFVDDGLVAAMTCYAAEPDLFDGEMVRLLDEMAADISFGLGSLAEARRMHENELRFATIFRSSPDCILIIRLTDDCIVDVNDAFLRAFDYVRGDVVGRGVSDMGLWSSDAARQSMLALLEQEGRIKDVEAVWLRSDGEARDCVVSGEIVVLGGIRHLTCVVTDVTDRRAIDRLLFAREQEFRALAENSPDIISRFDRNTRRIYANPEFMRCFGVSMGQVIGKTPAEGMPESQIAMQVQRVVEEVITTGHEAELDVSAPEGDAARLVHRHVRVVPEFDAEGRITSVLAIARDISRLKETKLRLREAQQQLRALDVRREHAREDERKRMAREIHDVLGQLLTALRLDIDMLGMEFGGDQPLLLERTKRAMHVVDETIAVVRSLASRLRPPVLEMGIVSALEWLAREFVTGHAGMHCTVTAFESEIELDEEQATDVFRIAQESLTNAARHAQAKNLSIGLRRIGGEYELEIADDGVGFDPEAVSVRSLGLVGMRERAAGLEGHIQIDTSPGRGTRIAVRFPAQPRKEMP
jgi:PAS domain S-box-containing protein